MQIGLRKIYVGTHDAQLGSLKDKLFALYDEYAKDLIWAQPLPHPLLLLVSLLLCNEALTMSCLR